VSPAGSVGAAETAKPPFEKVKQRESSILLGSPGLEEEEEQGEEEVVAGVLAGEEDQKGQEEGALFVLEEGVQGGGGRRWGRRGPLVLLGRGWLRRGRLGTPGPGRVGDAGPGLHLPRPADGLLLHAAQIVFRHGIPPLQQACGQAGKQA